MKKLSKSLMLVMVMAVVIPVAVMFAGCSIGGVNIPKLNIPEGVTVTAVAQGAPNGGSNAGSFIITCTVNNETESEYTFTAGAIKVTASLPGSGTHTLSVQNPGDLKVPADQMKSVNVTVSYNALISGPIVVKYGSKTISA